MENIDHYKEHGKTLLRSSASDDPFEANIFPMRNFLNIRYTIEM